MSFDIQQLRNVDDYMDPLPFSPLLESEIEEFARKGPTALRLGDILEKSEPHQAAAFLRTELPIRFAARIKQLDRLPYCEEIPKLRQVRQTFVRSFEEVRGIENRLLSLLIL